MTEPSSFPAIMASLQIPDASAAPPSVPSSHEKQVLQMLTALAQRNSIASHEIPETWGLVFNEIERIDSDVDQMLGSMQPEENEDQDVLSATLNRTIDILAQLTKPTD